MEGDTIVMQDVYPFDFGMGVDDDGRFLGRLKSTGIRPNFSERLADGGVRLEPELFTLEPFARRGRRAALIVLGRSFIGFIAREPVPDRGARPSRRPAARSSWSRSCSASAKRRSSASSRVTTSDAGQRAERRPAMADEQRDGAAGRRVTSRASPSAGVMAQAELLLEQADVPLRAGELLFYAPLAAIIVLRCSRSCCSARSSV